jgi:hypothetical protein
MRASLVVLLGLAFTAGCSSSYQPVRSPRIVTVVDSGQPAFVKNGERVGTLALGTGLVDAVHGNPRAEHQARVGRNLSVGGFVLAVAGLGTEIGGLVVLAQDSHSDEHSSLGPALLLTGAVVAITGSVLMLAGQPHLYDAVNIYNDELETGPATQAAAAPLGPRVQPLGPRVQ